MWPGALSTDSIAGAEATLEPVDAEAAKMADIFNIPLSDLDVEQPFS